MVFRIFSVILLFFAGCCSGVTHGPEAEGFSWPCTGIIYQGFYGKEISGDAPGAYFDEHDQKKVFAGPGRMHRAIDIDAPKGWDVVAARDGIAKRYDWDGTAAYGNRVVIEHSGGYWTLYAHLSKIQIRDLDQVKAGEKIGEIGSTGNSTGSHLHFEIRHSPDPNYLVLPHYIPGDPSQLVLKGGAIPYPYPKAK